MKRFLIIALLFIAWLASAQCTTGATQLLGDGKLYGCVEGQWRKLTEDVASNAGILGNLGNTQNINGVVHGRETNNVVSQLLNIGNSPINIADAPAHVVGKIYYSNSQKHFYQGVNGGLWHQIDNMVWSSTQTRAASGNFTRNNCGADYVGGTITYTPSSTASAASTISQADADTKAANQAYSQAVSLVSSNGQNYANSNASCTQIRWTSTKCSKREGTVYRNNCGSGFIGGSVIYSTGNICRTYTSNISQADADNQAQAQADAASLAYWNNNAQNYANANAGCTQTIFTSTKCSANTGPVYRNNCPSPYAGGSVTYSTGTICSTYTSNISQADADNHAQSQAVAASEANWNANAQNYANSNASCTAKLYKVEQYYSTLSVTGPDGNHPVYSGAPPNTPSTTTYIGTVTYPYTLPNLFDEVIAYYGMARGGDHGGTLWNEYRRTTSYYVAQ